MADIYPFNLPRQQLPQPTDRLSDGLLHATPALVGLWMPSKLALAAADFTPLPQKHFGALSGGITTTPGGFGVLGAAWKLSGSNGIVVPFSNSFQFGTSDFAITAVFQTSSTVQQTIIDNRLSTSAQTGFDVNFTSTAINLQLNDLSAAHNYQISNSSLTNGTFHNLTVSISRTNTTATFYLDGVAIGSSNISATSGSITNNSSLYLGVFHGLAAGVVGSMALIGLFSSALTASQVSDLYNCLRTGEPFPLFETQTAAMMMGSAAAPAGGGLLLRRRRAAA